MGKVINNFMELAVSKMGVAPSFGTILVLS